MSALAQEQHRVVALDPGEVNLVVDGDAREPHSCPLPRFGAGRQ
jgi:hypothetical protein